MWHVHFGEVPELYPVLVAVAYQLYVTPVFVLTLNLHEAAPRELLVVVHIVPPLTVMATVAPETALPLLVTLALYVTVEPVFTLAPFAGLIRAMDNDLVLLKV